MKTLLDLDPNDCRFPMNDGSPYLFCAEPKELGSSYCAEHHQICLRKDHGLMGRENNRFAAMVRRSRLPALALFVDLEAAE